MNTKLIADKLKNIGHAIESKVGIENTYYMPIDCHCPECGAAWKFDSKTLSLIMLACDRKGSHGMSCKNCNARFVLRIENIGPGLKRLMICDNLDDVILLSYGTAEIG